MYSVRLGYEAAKKRINRLLSNGHKAEALVASVATVEKILRRTLQQIVISAGFTTDGAEKIVRNLRSLQQLKQQWVYYEPQNRKLMDVIGNLPWQTLVEAARKRNDLVHGKLVYSKKECEKVTKNVLSALDSIKETFDDEYGYSGWGRMSGRKTPCLHVDPRIAAKSNSKTKG